MNYSTHPVNIKHVETCFDDAGNITSGKCCEGRLYCIFIDVWSMPLQLHPNHHALHE